MTYYNYLDEMQVLCIRASEALKVIKPEDPVLSDIYEHAEEGFFSKKQSCPVKEANSPVKSARTERLMEFSKRVQQWEEKAACCQREQENTKKEVAHDSENQQEGLVQPVCSND